MAQHAATTPAPSIGLGVKASLSGHPSTVRAPPSVLATAGHPRGSSMASCLKAPAAATAAAGAGAGQHDHHIARAVTFAADVHDAGVVLGAHGQPHRAGGFMQCAGSQGCCFAVFTIPLCQSLKACCCFANKHQSIGLLFESSECNEAGGVLRCCVLQGRSVPAASAQQPTLLRATVGSCPTRAAAPAGPWPQVSSQQRCSHDTTLHFLSSACNSSVTSST